MEIQNLKEFLDQKAAQYNRPEFIAGDPISIPHRFQKLQDREIAGFFTAILSWGNRTTIIRNALQLMEWMDQSPHEFVLGYKEKDLKRFLGFRHRTFNPTDLLYCISFFREYYTHFLSLETAFSAPIREGDQTVENGLNGFRRMFFSGDFPERTQKHVSSPEKGSSCKRLNMFLRWMVRRDDRGVDFGIWHSISPAQLVCPVDVHVARVARKLRLMDCSSVNWDCALTLTDNLRKFDPKDPVKYDFGLFGLGVIEKYG
ncbi:MAG TPA: TIGR02757 family protein [Chitinophagaceae bacterium]|nr:TIGR02757 family protein [Chitinophagaceae bacterium]